MTRPHVVQGVPVRRLLCAVAFAAGALGTCRVVPAAAHPLHTTITDLVTDGRTVRASIRIFSDDFNAGIARREPQAQSSPAVFERAAFAYVARTVVLRRERGAIVPLSWCGLRRENDLVVLCVRASLPAGTRHWSLSNTLLHEMFDDQVNVVRATRGTARQHLLFVRGDGAKAIR